MGFWILIDVYFLPSLDPTNRCAMAGLLAMGQSSSGTSGIVNTSYLDTSMAEEGCEQDNPLEMIEIPQSVQNDIEDSEIMWSDVEIEINQ